MMAFSVVVQATLYRRKPGHNWVIIPLEEIRCIYSDEQRFDDDGKQVAAAIIQVRGVTQDIFHYVIETPQYLFNQIAQQKDAALDAIRYSG